MKRGSPIPEYSQRNSKHPEREQAAAYVAELSGNLALLARQHGLDALGFILDMARLEAEGAMRPAIPPAESAR